MKTYISILLCFFFFTEMTYAQRNIPLNQIDSRFTIRAETAGISFGSEYYRFYIKNNTNEKYKLVVNVTVYSPCFETKNYKLGILREVFLEPGGEFTPRNDYYHIFNGGENTKDCRIRLANNESTYISKIQYSYSNIINLTQEEAKKEKEKLAKEKEKLEKEAEEKKKKEIARLEKEAQIKEVEEKKIKDAATAEEEKNIAQQRESQRKSDQDNTSYNSHNKSANGYSNDNSTRKNSDGAIPHNPAQDNLPDLVRTKGGGYFQRGSDGQFREINQDDYYRAKNISNDTQEQERKRTQQEAEHSVKEQQDAYKRQQQKWQEDFQAQLEQNRIDRQNLEAAGDVAAQQIASGNYQQAGITYGTELAKQGYGEAALVSLGLGTGLQIIGDIAKEKKRKEEVENRRLEQIRIQKEREREKEELLQRQKIQFEKMVAAQRAAKKSIINSRIVFLAEEVTYTKTFDKFSRSREPIYIFFVEANNEFKFYQERVSFPDQAEIRIKENVNLSFSPILRINPNSNGEYPFLKAILDKIKNELVQKSGSTYKIFNWSSTLEDAQKHYKSVSQQAISAKFIPNFPEINLMDFNAISQENDLYWTLDRDSIVGPISDLKSDQALDYWNLATKTDSLQVSKMDMGKTDYWKREEKRDSLNVQKPKLEENNYWNTNKD